MGKKFSDFLLASLYAKAYIRMGLHVFLKEKKYNLHGGDGFLKRTC